MSLITQCPACATMFKVVSDQLRISDGWVRCGQCDEVFDANANLYADPELQDGTEAQEIPSSPVESVDWKSSLQFSSHQSERAANPVIEEDSLETDAFEVLPRSDEVQGEDSLALARFEPVVDFGAAAGLDPLLDLRPGHGIESLGSDVKAPSADVLPAPVAEPRYAQVQMKTVEPTEVPKLSFVRPARRGGAWQAARARVLLSLVALLLLTAFCVQLVLHTRDRIAATEPAAKNVLLALCSWADCKVQPVRQIESVVIESSSFTKVRSDVYRLNFALKSTAVIPLAIPALELTLTDMQDQPVVRRVLLASEWGKRKDVLEAGTELTEAIPIAVQSSGSTERISGYRLLAFYP